MLRALTFVFFSYFLFADLQAQDLTGIPASDTLGAEDLAGNPTFIGGVANGGGTAHGVW